MKENCTSVKRITFLTTASIQLDTDELNIPHEDLLYLGHFCVVQSLMIVKSNNHNISNKIDQDKKHFLSLTIYFIEQLNI